MFVNTSSLTSKRSSPSTLIQDTIGEGILDKLHDRVTLPPSVMFTFSIGCMAEGTANKQQPNAGKQSIMTGSRGADLHNC